MKLTGAPWLPYERQAFDDTFKELTAERLWVETSRVLDRQPDDASGKRVMFETRPDLGGIKVRLEWMAKRLDKPGKLSRNEWFVIIDTDELKSSG